MTVTEAVDPAVGSPVDDPSQATTEPPSARWRRGGVLVPHLIGILVVVAVHSYAAWDAVGPVYLHDEIGYLLNGRALSGDTPSGHLGPMGFYHAGWPLLTLPLHWLIDDPATLYRAVLWQVAVLGGLQVVPLSWLAGRVLAVPQRWRAPLATVAALIPGRSLLGGYAFAEAAYTLAFLAVLVCLVRWRARPGGSEALLLGLAAGFTYTIHGKGSAVAALTLAVLALDFVRTCNRATWLGAASLILTVVATHGLHRWLRSELYVLAFDRTSNALGMFERLEPRATASTVAGGAWYLFVATAGVAAVGIVTLARRAWADTRQRRFDLPSYYFLAAVGLALVSMPLFAVIVAKGDNRLDFVVYGRHWDSVVGLAVLAGLATVTVGASRRVVVADVVVAALLTAGAGLALRLIALPSYLEGLPVAPSAIPGLTAWIGPVDRVIPILAPTVLALATLAGCLALQVRGRPAVPLLVGCVFLVLSVQGEHRFFQPFDRPNRHRLTIHDDIARLDVAAVGYDLDELVVPGRNGYQYWLADIGFLEFDSTEGPPPTEVVIARSDWPAAAWLRAVPVAVEGALNEAVWVLPGELQDRLRDEGQLCAPGDGTGTGAGAGGTGGWVCR